MKAIYSNIVLVILVSLMVISCRNKEEATIDPCVSCRDENNFVGEYSHKECIDNRCQCPPGTVIIGDGCHKERKGVLKADLKNTPLECFENAILILDAPEKSEKSWDKMNIYYSRPFDFGSGPQYSSSGISISTSYTIGAEYDLIEDNFFQITAWPCDSISALGIKAKIEAKYYKKLDVMDIRFIRWHNSPANVIDTFHVIFK